MMKRITITLDEEMYLRLLEYSLERSKSELRNVSTGEAVRGPTAMEIRRMGRLAPGGHVKRSYSRTGHDSDSFLFPMVFRLAPSLS